MSGTIATMRYDAFGNTLEAEGPRAGENPYRFSTKEWHGPSGLYDYGFRFYSPGMGRWMNRDPLQEEGGVNLYAMVGNNPINDVDEYGEVGLKELRDSAIKWVDEQLFGKPKNYSSDEDGEVQRAVDANAQVKQTGPKAAVVGMEVYMAVMPMPGPKGLGSVSRAASSSKVLLTRSAQLQRKWKHAIDFGIKGAYNKKNAALFSRALNTHINSPGTRVIVGTYQRNPALLHLNPKTGLAVVTKYSGEFVSGWKASSAQVIFMLRLKKLGGGG